MGGRPVMLPETQKCQHIIMVTKAGGGGNRGRIECRAPPVARTAARERRLAVARPHPDLPVHAKMVRVVAPCHKLRPFRRHGSLDGSMVVVAPRKGHGRAWSAGPSRQDF